MPTTRWPFTIGYYSIQDNATALFSFRLIVEM